MPIGGPSTYPWLVIPRDEESDRSRLVASGSFLHRELVISELYCRGDTIALRDWSQIPRSSE